MAENDEHLLARWRELLGAIRGYDGQALDPVDRQTLNELRQQLTRTEEELDRRGLRHGQQREQGNWQPLALNEPIPASPAPPVELTWEKEKTTVDFRLLELADMFDITRLDEDAWFEHMRGRAPSSLVDEFLRERLREWPRFDECRPSGHHREPRFVPDILDGLTLPQRQLLEVLAGADVMTAETLVSRTLELAPTARGLDEALDELRLPRPYPLIDDAGGQLRLSPLAREMMVEEHGRWRVDGALFPNLLVNGCVDPLSFPTYSLGSIVRAVLLLMDNALADDQDLGNSIGQALQLDGRCVVNGDHVGWTGALPLIVLPRRPQPSGVLEFRFDHPADATNALERLSLARGRGEFDEGTDFEVTQATLTVRLPAGQHGLAVCHRLLLDRALESWWRIRRRVSNRRGAWNASVRELLEVFLERSRARVASVLRRTLQVPNERRDVLHALLRVADDEELARLVSTADASGEGKWALMRLGTTALTHHARLGSFEVAGPPMTETQAQAVIETEGIRRKRRFFELELEGLEAELRTREVSVDATRIDDRLRAELGRVLRLAPNLSGRNDLIAHHWIHRSR